MAVQPMECSEKLELKRSLCRAIVGLQEAILSNEHDTAGSLAQVRSSRRFLHGSCLICYVWSASTRLGSQAYHEIGKPVQWGSLHLLQNQSHAS